MTQDKRTHVGILGEMTIEEVEQLDPEVVVIGIGSTEPHGPHLPYGTDVYQTEAICYRSVTRANERGASALTYPTLPIGNNVNFKAFPFACRIGVRTLMNVVLDIVEALEEEGIHKVVLVNGHGGNPATLRATLREHTGRHDPGNGAFLCLINTFDVIDEVAGNVIEHPSDHAGERETSNILHLRPDLVREDEFEAFPMEEPTLESLKSNQVSFVPPWHAYMPQSAGGETNESTREKGEEIIKQTSEWLSDLLVELDDAPMHELFPYPQGKGDV